MTNELTLLASWSVSQKLKSASSAQFRRSVGALKENLNVLCKF